MSSKSYLTDKYYGLDILKLFLAILVVLRHLGQTFFKDSDLFYEIFTNLLSPVAVPTYFLISGFLLFRNCVTKINLLKQIQRIAILYVVWGTVYFPINLWVIVKSEKKFLAVIDFIQRSIFSGTYFHLWFLPSLIVALVVVYVLQSRFTWKKTIFICSMLYIIGIIVETYRVFLPLRITNLCDLYLRFFLTARNGLFFGSIYVCMGALMAKKQELMDSVYKSRFIICLIGFFATYIEFSFFTQI